MSAGYNKVYDVHCQEKLATLYTHDRYPQAEKPAAHFSTFGFFQHKSNAIKTKKAKIFQRLN